MNEKTKIPLCIKYGLYTDFYIAPIVEFRKLQTRKLTNYYTADTTHFNKSVHTDKYVQYRAYM